MAKQIFVNYYEKFSLDRTMSESEIRTELGIIQRDIIRRQATTDPSDSVMLLQLQDNMLLAREAIRNLTNAKSRAAYDKKLDAYLNGGNGTGASVAQNAAPPPGAGHLQKARDYFEKGAYEYAIRHAKAAIGANCNTGEPYEIIGKSAFILGDYDDAVAAVDRGAAAFGNDRKLAWLAIRFRTQMERYQESQQRINFLRKKFGVYSQLAAEQVYLYYFAEKDDLGKRFLDKFMASHPSDDAFRKETANNLIDISHQCYVYDADADLLLITEKEDYERALRLVKQANSLYQDPYTLQELENVKAFGEKEFDKEHRGTRNTYFVGALVLGFIGIQGLYENYAGHMLASLQGASSYYVLLSVLAVACVLFGIIAQKTGMRPAWQLYRDEIRGFRESEDGILYNILSLPWDMVKMVLWGLIG